MQKGREVLIFVFVVLFEVCLLCPFAVFLLGGLVVVGCVAFSFVFVFLLVLFFFLVSVWVCALSLLRNGF